jgi:AcrR family transcriptional regulator
MHQVDRTDPVHGARRERKKRQTRDALIEAALKLFEAKGYEHTAIHEITDAVDVSERTFFRYFASKEDLVLSFVRDLQEVLTEQLAARPPAEEPLMALRNAFRLSVERLSMNSGIGHGPGYPSVSKLIDSSPTLLAANLRFFHEKGEHLARVLAEREGVDPATDLRPRVLVGVFGSMLSMASHDCRAGGEQGGEQLVAAFDAYASQLVPALAGHWEAREAAGPAQVAQ